MSSSFSAITIHELHVNARELAQSHLHDNDAKEPGNLAKQVFFLD